MAKKKNKHTPSDNQKITIRMYNVGFGDAFLVLIPEGGTTRRVLFDCGSIAAGGVPMADVVQQIVADVTDDDGVPRIDVVVATHRHRDHVSGFSNAAWSKVHVKEVWMPWTEDPSDPEGRRIRDIQAGLALSLNASLAAAGAALTPTQLRYSAIVENALMLSNDAAMKTLHSGFRGSPKRRFLPEQESEDELVRLLETDALPGVRVHVLGPQKSEDVIRDMDPPKGKSYLRLRAAASGSDSAFPSPFASEFCHAAYAGAGTFPEQDKARIERAGESSDFVVAVALDQAVNGTSLMLMLEIAGTFLLFPGDAQWGTWKAALADQEWRDLFERISFYKIGHHGSHNATPKEFVEDLMPDRICAMASTLPRSNWPGIPKTELLVALEKKHTDIARSDETDDVGEMFHVSEGVIETYIPI